jgi:CelD/BcsL family acetyltransferase involved in cellulose biosynthesis
MNAIEPIRGKPFADYGENHPLLAVAASNSSESCSMPQIKIARTAHEMAKLRPLWESLCQEERATIFQDFGWNTLALSTFSGREGPWVVCVEASYGLAIIPAVLRHADGSLRLLGEELFDYRAFLCQGEDAVLAHALAELAALQRPMEAIAVREQDRRQVLEHLTWCSFSAAPQVRCAHVTSEEFGARHGRLARNLRRLERQGFALRCYSGEDSPLVRSIYELKALQDPSSLFHDPLRIEFLVHAGLLQPSVFEIFTFERGSCMAAALVTLRERSIRRFYTGWFAPELEKLSPAVTLIYEITRRSLAEGLDCDYMTGEQPYKMRLATDAEALYRLQASPEELAVAGRLSSVSSVTPG